MKITPFITLCLLCLLLPVVILVGCGKPMTVGKETSDAAGEAVPADVTAHEAAPPAPPAAKAEPSEQKCLAENYKLEAARRHREVELEPLFLEAGLHARLAALLVAVTEAAAGRKFDTIEAKVAKTWQEMKPFRPATSDGDLELMENAVRERIAAHAMCRAVASRDSSWCTSLKGISKDSVKICIWNYAAFAIIGDGAIAKGKSCEEAVGNFQGLPHKNLLAACKAIKEQKPEQCPWKETETPGILCRAAATRATTHVCEKIVSEKRDREIGCCELFSWRFANIVSGHADPYVIPEAGALSGDEKGCARGLAWGLMEDVGPLFGLEVPGTPPADLGKDRYGNYLCPMILYWSQREPPPL